jgi:hypothetical protein
MFVFQWNALRVGDRVNVHDDLDPALTRHEGVVKLVETRQRAANEISVRLDDGGSGMLRPRRHAVHLLPMDARFPCWRCDAVAASRIGVDHVGGA